MIPIKPSREEVIEYHDRNRIGLAAWINQGKSDGLSFDEAVQSAPICLNVSIEAMFHAREAAWNELFEKCRDRFVKYVGLSFNDPPPNHALDFFHHSLLTSKAKL